MGDSVYLERRLAITRGEWDALVANDPEMKHVDAIEATNPKTGEVIRMGGGFDLWLGHPEMTKGVPLSWSAGKVSVRPAFDQDDPLWTKLRELAQKLGAEIKGEGGEVYE
jgi:hypothetical protein